ncbi:MAG: hypothetical protein JNJ57_03885 [Saprospiraceae bacterium]|nr:hypothetical protein [Saprospiraceae bacterium]
MRTTPFFLFAFTALLFASCQTEQSSDVNQDRIFTQYELLYNANEDITYARAWFRFGNATGTLLELSAPSQVEIDGQALNFVALLGYYEKKIAGLNSSGTFRWEDAEGKVFENTITINPIDFGAGLDTIARNAALEIPFTGAPLAEHEIVGVWINGENEGDAQAAVTIENGATAIIVAANKLANVGAGPGKIYMDRRFTPPLSESTSAGGTGSGVHRAKPKQVVFN